MAIGTASLRKLSEINAAFELIKIAKKERRGGHLSIGFLHPLPPASLQAFQPQINLVADRRLTEPTQQVLIQRRIPRFESAESFLKRQQIIDSMRNSNGLLVTEDPRFADLSAYNLEQSPGIVVLPYASSRDTIRAALDHLTTTAPLLMTAASFYKGDTSTTVQTGGNSIIFQYYPDGTYRACRPYPLDHKRAQMVSYGRYDHP